jgi:transcription elongation factor GreA
MSNKTQTVSVGTSVKLVEHGTDDEEIFQVVEDSQVNLLQNKIPVANPMGQALLGKKSGDEVSLNGPTGEVKFSVLEIIEK